MTQGLVKPIDVHIRDVEDSDVPLFFEHQRDPEANLMANFPAREREAFLAHWAKIRADPACVTQTVEVAGRAVGNVVSWADAGRTYVGYWIGREDWGRGIATSALRLLLDLVTTRPLYAYAAVGNAGSIRVLEKCGFTQVPADKVSPAPSDAADVEEFLLVLSATR